MAKLYSNQYQDAYVSVPSVKIDPGQVNAHKKVLFADITFAAELATTDTVYLGKLPKGARVLNCMLRFPASGATGIVDIGYQANGVDSADLNAFVEGADPGAAAVLAAGAGAGIGKVFTAETTVVMTPTEVTAASTGDVMQFWIEYVVA